MTLEFWFSYTTSGAELDVLVHPTVTLARRNVIYGLALIAGNNSRLGVPPVSWPELPGAIQPRKAAKTRRLDSAAPARGPWCVCILQQWHECSCSVQCPRTSWFDTGLFSRVQGLGLSMSGTNIILWLTAHISKQSASPQLETYQSTTFCIFVGAGEPRQSLRGLNAHIVWSM